MAEDFCVNIFDEIGQVTAEMNGGIFNNSLVS